MRDRYDDDEPVRNTPSLFLVLTVALAAVAVVFVLQNNERATITFLFFEGEFRVWTAILVAILLGVLLDRVLQTWRRRARRGRDG